MRILSRLLKRGSGSSAGSPGGPAPAGKTARSAEAIPGAVPAQLYPGAMAETRPYSWRGPAPRSAVAVLAVDPVITGEAIDEAFHNLVGTQEPSWPELGGVAASHSPLDRAALQATFEDVAHAHLAPLRNLILEIRWGEDPISSVEVVRPMLRSLRAMGVAMELPDLVTAVDGFTDALDRAAPAGASGMAPAAREELLRAYEPLVQSLPRALTVDDEWDRREAMVVESLLGQLPEIDPLMLGRLSGRGLTRLENLSRATGAEIASAAGIPRPLADAVVAKVQDFRRSAPAIVASDRDLASRTLEALLVRLEAEHQRFERAAGGWTPEDVATKRQARREREQSYLALRALLARLGNVDLVASVEKLSFGERIEELSRFVRGG